MIGKLQRFSQFIPKKIPFGLTDVSALMVSLLVFLVAPVLFSPFLSDY